MNKFVYKRRAILNLAAILEFGTETKMVPNLDVFRIQRPTSVPIFTDFSQFEQLLGIVSPICSTIIIIGMHNIRCVFGRLTYTVYARKGSITTVVKDKIVECITYMTCNLYWNIYHVFVPNALQIYMVFPHKKSQNLP